MLAKGKTPKVLIASERMEPVADIPEGRPPRGGRIDRKAASQAPVRARGRKSPIYILVLIALDKGDAGAGAIPLRHERRGFPRNWMKKLIYLVSIMLFPMMAMAATHDDAVPPHAKSAGTLQKVTAATEKQNVYDISFFRNGKLVAKSSVSVLSGSTVPFSNGVEHAFISSSTKNTAGVTKLVPGTYMTGMSGIIERSAKSPDHIKVSLNGSVFLSMRTMHGVQLPKLDTDTLDQSMSLVPGQTLKLRGYSKNGGTTMFVITRE
jgi:hypothetical protein